MSSGHQRNTSQGQQLIVERGDRGDEEISETLPTLASPSHPMSSMPSASAPSVDSFFSIHPNPQDNRQYCEDPTLRDNMKVVAGSVILTILGTVLLVTGAVAIILPHETGLHGLVFLFAGFLFFVPGIYHVVYILCTIFGRPGYSFNNLPTFNK